MYYMIIKNLAIALKKSLNCLDDKCDRMNMHQYCISTPGAGAKFQIEIPMQLP